MIAKAAAPLAAVALAMLTSCSGIHARAAHDLGCDQSKITVSNVGAGLVIASGCGREAEYLCAQNLAGGGSATYTVETCDLKKMKGPGRDSPSRTYPRGELGGACYPNKTCNEDLFCTHDRQCVIWDFMVRTEASRYAPGALAGPCRADGTCDESLSCSAGRCAPEGKSFARGASSPSEGDANGACYPNKTCNTGLACVDDACVAEKRE